MLKILVVDDDQCIRDLFVIVFRGLGYEVEEAPSAAEALAICEKHCFDFVFTDYNMGPGMDGIEFANTLAKSWNRPRVILVTGSEITKEEAGPNIEQVFWKPVTLNKLTSALMPQ